MDDEYIDDEIFTRNKNENSINNFSISNTLLNIDWNKDHEKIMIEWADKAMCYRWLHSRARAKFSKANTFFTIPVIVMSTVTGTANFAINKLDDDNKSIASMIIGTINIAAGIITTIQQFLKISELNEAHRAASIAWDKFYRNIKTELAKAPNERIPVMQMLKHCKEEFDRLMETSPSIPDIIIEQFKTTFSDGLSKMKGQLPINLSSKQNNYLQLKKPEICDTIESTINSVYKEPPIKISSKPSENAIILAKKSIIENKNNNKIKNIINIFKEEKGRFPTVNEINDELDDSKIELNEIEKYLTNYLKDSHHNIQNIVDEILV